MDPAAVKGSLEAPPGVAAGLPAGFYDALVLGGLRLDLVEPGRVICSFTVPPRLSSSGSYLHGGVVSTLVDVIGSAPFYSAGIRTSGVSLDIGVSYLDVALVGEEIEVEAKLLHAGKSVGVTSVEFRNKGTGKLIARGRHTKYLAVSSKL